MPKGKIRKIYYEDPNFKFEPIPFTPNMKIIGYFQSEKYFQHNKQLILDTFEPSKKIKDYLYEKYQELILNPKTVGVHLRAYELEHISLRNEFDDLRNGYYKNAIELFPQDSLFVIFSDNIEWAKKILKDLDRQHIYIEGEHYSHDFYLLSYCKHQILCQSTFGWWAAYLNKNPDKIVVVPDPWFTPPSTIDLSHITPEGWIKLCY